MKKETKKKIIDIAIISSWVILSLLLIYYILCGCRAVLNYDSAFIVDYSLEQIRTGSIFPNNWCETNDFWIYSLIPFITFFIKCGLGLFQSRQLAALIQGIVIFILLFRLFYDKKDKNNFLIPGLILVSGISGQVLLEIFGDATYGTILACILLILDFAITYLKNQKKRYVILIGVLLTLLTMCSIRFPIYIVAPLIVVLIYLYIKTGLKDEYVYLGMSLACATIAGYVLHTILAENLIYITNVNREVISNSAELGGNIFAVLYQILWSCGGSNTNVYAADLYVDLGIATTSPMVVFIFVRYIFAIVTMLMPIILIKKVKQFDLKETIIYIFITALFIIISFFTIIGDMAYWHRYMVPVVFLLVTLYVYFYKYCITEQRIKNIFHIILAIFVMYSVFLNVSTFYSIEDREFKENPYQGLAEFLVENDLEYGYQYQAAGANALYLLTEGKVRSLFVMGEPIRPYPWLVSLDWFEKDYHTGKTFFMRLDRQPEMEVEDQATEILEYRVNANELWKIFVFKNNDIMYNALNN